MAEDMVEVPRTGPFMERVRHEDGRNPTPEHAPEHPKLPRSVFPMAAIGPWQQGRPDHHGRPAPATGARVARRLDLRASGQARDVEAVMVDGKWLMRDGVVLTMNEPAILAEAQRIANKAWSQQFRARMGPEILTGFRPKVIGRSVDPLPRRP